MRAIGGRTTSPFAWPRQPSPPAPLPKGEGSFSDSLSVVRVIVGRRGREGTFVRRGGRRRSRSGWLSVVGGRRRGERRRAAGHVRLGLRRSKAGCALIAAAVAHGVPAVNEPARVAAGATASRLLAATVAGRPAARVGPAGARAGRRAACASSVNHATAKPATSKAAPQRAIRILSMSNSFQKRESSSAGTARRDGGGRCPPITRIHQAQRMAVGGAHPTKIHTSPTCLSSDLEGGFVV